MITYNQGNQFASMSYMMTWVGHDEVHIWALSLCICLNCSVIYHTHVRLDYCAITFVFLSRGSKVLHMDAWIVVLSICFYFDALTGLSCVDFLFLCFDRFALWCWFSVFMLWQFCGCDVFMLWLMELVFGFNNKTYINYEQQQSRVVTFMSIITDIESGI